MAHILLLAHPEERHAEVLLRALQRHLPEYTFTLGAARLVLFGGSVRASLQSALERTQAVLVLFNAKTTLEGWLDQPETPDRLALALALRQNKPVQPILFPDGTLPAKSALPPELHPLADRLVFRLNTQERFSELIQALRSLNNHHVPAVQPTLEPAPRDSTSDPQAPQPTQDDIRQFLANAGITVRSVGEPQAYDEPLDRIAQHMGTRYPHIKLVYQSIKRSLIDGETFSLNLGGQGDRCILYSTQLCSQLRALALLEYYEYRRAPQYKLTARPSRIPLAYSFFTGGWLERYTRVYLKGVLAGVPFAMLHNVHVVLPEERNFEFDILLSVGTSRRILWFETKTADYQDRIHRYAMLARSMGLPPEQVYLILLEVPQQTCEELSRMYKLNVLNLDGLQTLTAPQLLGN